MVSPIESLRRGVRRWALLTAWRRPHTERKLIEQLGDLSDTVLGRFDPGRHLRLEPFPYIHIPDALPPDVYRNLTQNYPSNELILRHCRWLKGGVPGPNTRHDLPAGKLLDGSAEVSPCWLQFVRNHTSQSFLAGTLLAFLPAIRRYYPDLPEWLWLRRDPPTAGVRFHSDQCWRCSVAMDCGICINTPHDGTPTSVIGTHLDNPVELYAGLFYVPHPDDTAKGGNLLIQRWRDPAQRRAHTNRIIPSEAIETVTEIPYAPNTFVMFLNTPDSVHAVTPREASPLPRRLVNIIGEIYPRLGGLYDPV